MKDDNLRSAAQQYFNERDHDIRDTELNRLADARRLALSARSNAKSRFARSLVFASVVSVFTVSTIWSGSFGDFSAVETNATIEIKEVIIDTDIDPDVLADYEFYQWISEQELDAG
ncbi:MAG: hypothetical protein HWD83_01925 [Gammaproteobacteria bacterium]|nr:hypothetical protein [Gammaproteobacteria bacterium]